MLNDIFIFRSMQTSDKTETPEYTEESRGEEESDGEGQK